MKVTLKTDTFIRGFLTESGTTVDVDDMVAEVIINEGIATKVSAKAKKTNKAES